MDIFELKKGIHVFTVSNSPLIVDNKLNNNNIQMNNWTHNETKLYNNS